MSLLFIKDLVNEIINDCFTHPLSINFKGNDFIDVSFNSLPLKQYKTLLQGGNNLCGFYSIFTLTQFIKYKTRNDARYLQAMSSRWKFWRFYAKTLRKLLNELKIEPSGIKSLLSQGPLERYQFNYLIRTSPLFSSSPHTETSLVTFFFGFGLLHCTSKADLKQNQLLIDAFSAQSGEKREFLIVLMGIVNHWNILVIEKKPKGGGCVYHFLDARNIDVLSIEEARIEAYSKEMIDYLSKFNRVPSLWWMKCFGQWVEDMHKAMTLIIDVVQGRRSLFGIYFGNKLELMLSSFEAFNGICLDEGGEGVKNTARLFKWMREEYHPIVANEELVEAIEVFECNEHIKHLRLFTKFFLWLNSMEKAIEDYLKSRNDNEDTEGQGSSEDIQLALKYNQILSKIKRLLKV